MVAADRAHMSVLLRIAYDGTDFHGFARQPGACRTVQATVEAALQAVYRRPVPIRGASRTDAGVHALGQVVALDPPLEIPRAGLIRAIGDRLPSDVAVTQLWIEYAPDGGPVLPRFANLGKHYRYRIRVTRASDPFTCRFAWQFGRALNVEAMVDAARCFVGQHDFTAFRAGDCQSPTTVRRVTSVAVTSRVYRGGPPHAAPCLEVDVDVHGEAFLKRMVRVMAGTLVGVGWGERTGGSIEAALETGDRRLAGRTAPASGLTLVEVRWRRVEMENRIAAQMEPDSAC
ncbi:MAG: tRNA pseudouridine(38-40) synthase TruA [Nannocystaceae bacterium]